MFPSILSTVPLNIGFSLIRSFLCPPCSRPSAGSPHFCSSCCLELLLPWLIYSHLLRLTSRVIFLSKPAFSALAGAKVSLQGAGLSGNSSKAEFSMGLSQRQWICLTCFSVSRVSGNTWRITLAPRRRCPEPPLHPPGGRAGQGACSHPGCHCSLGVWSEWSNLYF